MTDDRRPEATPGGADLFRLLAANVLDYAVFVIDAERRVRTWSHGAERLFGYAEGEIVGRPADVLYTPEDRAAGQAEIEIRQALAEGRGEDDRWHVRKDGTRFWSAGVLTPLRDEAGRLHGFAKIMRDQTGLKLAEEARREGERRLRTLADNLPHGAIYQAIRDTPDSSTRFTYMSGGVERVFGVTPEEAIADPSSIYDMIHPDDLPVVAAAEAESVRTGQRFDCRFRHLSRSGELMWAHCRSAPRPLPDGRLVWEGIVLDVSEQVRAEERLRESERWTRTVLESITDAFYAVDRDWRFTYVNREAERLLGMSRAELLGRHRWTEYGVGVGTEFYHAYHRAMETGEAVVLEAYYPPHERWYEVHAYPSPEGLAVYFRDATEQRRAAEELRRQTKLLNTITDNADSALAMADIEGRLTFVNPAFARITGYSPEEAIGRLVHETVHYKYPDGRPFPVEECPLDGAYRQNPRAVRGHEDVFVRKDGTLFPVVASVAPLAEGGKVVGCVAEFRDVTKEKAAEAALLRSEQVSRFLADASAALADLTGDEGTLAKVARLAVPHFADWCAIDMLEGGSLRRVAVAHVDPSKVELAHELHRRFPPDPAAPQGVWNVLRTGTSEMIPEVTDGSLEAFAPDPELVSVLRQLGLRSYLAVPLRVRHEVLGVVTFVAAESGRRFDGRDLAVAEDLARRAAVAVENVRLYERLRDADRRKDEFLAMLAHELRNPLAPIRSGLDLLKMERTSDEIVGVMSEQLGHVVRLVDDLLDVSRILRGKVELKREPTDLSAVLRRAAETVRPRTEEHGQRLVVSLPDEPVRLDADPVRLTQVVANLLNNASKYTDDGGEVRLEANVQGGEAVVRVSDTGIGMEPALIPKVFDLFTQADQALARSQGGLGIGLTVVKSLVEMHGGTVSAASEGLRRGSTFTVRLPVSEPAEERQAPATDAASCGPLRILAVDDNAPGAKLLAMLLRKLGGHEVEVSHDGEAALEAAVRFRPDLILLDIGLPRMDGYEVARRLREHPEFRETLLVALTGYGTDEDRRRSVDAGFDDHLVKPPGVDMLRRLLAHPKLKRA